MASTAGRKRLPLPASLEHDLTALGFVYRESASIGRSYFIWQHKRFHSIELHVAKANIPGSNMLIWSFAGSNGCTTEEELIRRLEITIEFRTAPNIFLTKVSKP
jgi:hypothetical protein